MNVVGHHKTWTVKVFPDKPSVKDGNHQVHGVALSCGTCTQVAYRLASAARWPLHFSGTASNPDIQKDPIQYNTRCNTAKDTLVKGGGGGRGEGII